MLIGVVQLRNRIEARWAGWNVSTERRWAARAVVLGLMCLCLLVPTVRPDAPRHIQVTAKRFSFSPAEITVKKGEAVNLVLTSADVAHGLRVRELKIELRADKGKTAEATFTPQKTGTCTGHCSVFCGSGHGVMTFTIYVVS